MALTTTQGRGSFTISDIDGDWTYGTDVDVNAGFPANGMWVTSIQFLPTAVSDQLIIHDGGIDAQEVFDSGVVTSMDPVIKYFQPARHCKPVIDESDCTFGTAANAVCIIDYE